ncbi:MAG: phosphate-starvation-inducible PsiE family protein [Lacunisphaera sp.]
MQFLIMQPVPTTDPAWFDRAQRLLLQLCICFLFVAIAIEVVDLLYVFGKAIFTAPDRGARLLISREEAGRIVPLFLGILITLELIETMRGYVHNHAIRIQLILLVGLTAITRHLLAADLKAGDEALNFSLAALIVALAFAYFLIERSGGERKLL